MGIVIMGFCGLAMILSIKLTDETYNRYTYIFDVVKSIILIVIWVISVGTVFVPIESHKTLWLTVGLVGIVIPIGSILRSSRMYKERTKGSIEEFDGEIEA